MKNYTVKETAELVGVSRNVIYKALKEGKVKNATKWGRAWVIPSRWVRKEKKRRDICKLMQEIQTADSNLA